MASPTINSLILKNVDLTINLGENPAEEVNLGLHTFPNGTKVHLAFTWIMALHFLQPRAPPSSTYYPTFAGQLTAMNTQVTLTALGPIGAPAEFTWTDASGQLQTATYQAPILPATQLPTPPALHLDEVKLIIRLSEKYEEVEIHGKRYPNNSEVTITHDAVWNVVGYNGGAIANGWSPAFDGAKSADHAWVTLTEVKTGGLDFSWHNAFNPRDVFVVRYERNIHPNA